MSGTNRRPQQEWSLQTQDPLYHLANDRKSTPSTAVGAGQTIVVPTLQQARAAQIQQQHPEYTPFMVGVALYQEEQLEKKEQNLRRERAEKQKEARVAAQFRQVDKMMSLPQVLQPDGTVAPLDRKAMAWLHAYHPQIGKTMEKLLHLGTSANRCGLMDTILERDEQRAAELAADAEKDMMEHERRAKEIQEERRTYFAHKAATMRQKAAKVHENHDEKESENLKKLLKQSEESLEAAERRKMSLLAQKQLSVREKQRDFSPEKIFHILSEGTPKHPPNTSQSKQGRDPSPQTTEPASSPIVAMFNATNRTLTSQRSSERSPRAPKSPPTVPDHTERLQNLEREKEELRLHTIAVHESKRKKVEDRILAGLETTLKQSEKVKLSRIAAIEKANVAREELLADRADRALTSRGKLTGCSPPSKATGRKPSPEVQITASPRNQPDRRTDLTAQRLQAHFEQQEELYQQRAAALAESEKRLQQAAAQRKEEQSDRKLLHDARSKRIEKVQQNKAGQDQAAFLELWKKVQNEDAPRKFVPRPPLIARLDRKAADVEEAAEDKGYHKSAERVRSPQKRSLSETRTHSPPTCAPSLRREQKPSTARQERHALQIAKEEAAAAARAELLAAKKSYASSAYREERFAKNASRLESPPVNDQWRDTLNTASARARIARNEHVAQQFEAAESRRRAAAQRRAERQAEKEKALKEDLDKRASAHQNMFVLS